MSQQRPYRPVPRDDSGRRFTGSMADEALENDLGAQNAEITRLQNSLSEIKSHKGTILVSGYNLSNPTQITQLNIGTGLKVTVSGGIAYLSARYPAFAECVMVAMTNTPDEYVEYNNREYYVAPYTKFRIIVHQTNTNGNTYKLQYHNGTTWVDAGSPMTTGGVVTSAVADISYHQPWQDIPAAMITNQMNVIRVKLDHADGLTDTSLCVVQFWDGTAIPPSGSATTPPASPTTLPTVT